MDDKEKVRKALAKITKIIDEYKSWSPPNETDPHTIEIFNEIKNELSDSTMSDEEKINVALGEIYYRLYQFVDDSPQEVSGNLKKVKSILGQIPKSEAELQRLQKEVRDGY